MFYMNHYIYFVIEFFCKFHVLWAGAHGSWPDSAEVATVPGHSVEAAKPCITKLPATLTLHTFAASTPFWYLAFLLLPN